mmetsp:Transcript_27180/g.68264  ORF Transcript_27180/g.68264 Transcript_27180/m.68264 type:complete len:297 (-) Transcript_27180:355-1245(-)|eukprot:CAMPEP_0177650722 /NCGR_PEP_ID=MMETSP0447-20121125/12106_1 /TAXON_ID=0 /ORGANISM="Stygamoeba regulata, Strain BSH-02190019" /LENGTH=296 /DNA_ID=CAMNT_0019153635 /DNA_START=143 /DNA_END=1033 /DNA_ORIENTATION=+
MWGVRIFRYGQMNIHSTTNEDVPRGAVTLGLYLPKRTCSAACTQLHTSVHHSRGPRVPAMRKPGSTGGSTERVSVRRNRNRLIEPGTAEGERTSSPHSIQPTQACHDGMHPGASVHTPVMAAAHSQPHTTKNDSLQAIIKDYNLPPAACARLHALIASIGTAAVRQALLALGDPSHPTPTTELQPAAQASRPNESAYPVHRDSGKKELPGRKELSRLQGPRKVQAMQAIWTHASTISNRDLVEGARVWKSATFGPVMKCFQEHCKGDAALFLEEWGEKFKLTSVARECRRKHSAAR